MIKYLDIIEKLKNPIGIIELGQYFDEVKKLLEVNGSVKVVK